MSDLRFDHCGRCREPVHACICDGGFCPGAVHDYPFKLDMDDLRQGIRELWDDMAETMREHEQDEPCGDPAKAAVKLAESIEANCKSLRGKAAGWKSTAEAHKARVQSITDAMHGGDPTHGPNGPDWLDESTLMAMRGIEALGPVFEYMSREAKTVADRAYADLGLVLCCKDEDSVRDSTEHAHPSDEDLVEDYVAFMDRVNDYLRPVLGAIKAASEGVDYDIPDDDGDAD